MLIFQCVGKDLAEFGVEILDVWNGLVDIESERDNFLNNDTPCVVSNTNFCPGFEDNLSYGTSYFCSIEEHLALMIKSVSPMSAARTTHITNPKTGVLQARMKAK